MAILAWLAPLVVAAAAYVAARWLPLKKPRYWLYGALLLAAFVQNLSFVSFVNQRIDAVWRLALFFMVSEICFRVTRGRSRTVARVFAVVYVAASLGFFANWLLAGPRNGAGCRCPADVERRTVKNGVYAVTEARNVIARNRAFALCRQLSVPLFEQQVDKWTTPEGYYRTDFTLRWAEFPQGVRVDLLDAGKAIWTIGENLAPPPAGK